MSCVLCSCFFCIFRDYYVREELRFGPPYDLEVYGLEEAQERELEGGEGTNSSIRQVFNSMRLMLRVTLHRLTGFEQAESHLWL